MNRLHEICPYSTTAQSALTTRQWDWWLQTDPDSGQKKKTYAHDPHLDTQLVWAGEEWLVLVEEDRPTKNSKRKPENFTDSLVETVRNSVAIDWTLWKSGRAQPRVLIKGILRRYGYLSDKWERATQVVLEQAKLPLTEWATT